MLLSESERVRSACMRICVIRHACTGAALVQAKYFKQVDRDGSGEVDRAEFEMAFYAVDPVSGNSLGFQPSLMLHPRDAYEVRVRVYAYVCACVSGRVSA